MTFDWTQGSLAEGLRRYEAGEFFAAHEAWESLWLESQEPEKTFLQGLTQVTAAFHHLQRNNSLGTTRLLQGSLRRLEPYPACFGGISVILLCNDIPERMYVIGGLIVGSPNDTVDSIEANLAFARQHVDWPYIQHPTPYPRTPMTDDFRRRGLIENERLEEYDGTTSVVRNEHLSADEIEYLRWKAERGMKTRHMPAAFRHDPWFVARNVAKMAAHTYRGSTIRTMLGLEDERQAFMRYKEIRGQERHYL